MSSFSYLYLGAYDRSGMKADTDSMELMRLKQPQVLLLDSWLLTFPSPL